MNAYIEQEIERLNREMGRFQKKIDWLKLHSHQIPAGLEPRFSYDEWFDFDNLDHAKVVEVLQKFGGRWNKHLNGDDRIDYIQEIDGIRVRCYQGEPPPNCQVIETVEVVPAQPASTRKVRKLVCKDTADAS